VLRRSRRRGRSGVACFRFLTVRIRWRVMSQRLCRGDAEPAIEGCQDCSVCAGLSRERGRAGWVKCGALRGCVRGLSGRFPGVWRECSARVVSGPHLLPCVVVFVNRIRAGIPDFTRRLFWTIRGKNWAERDLPDDASDTQQIVLTESGSTIYCVQWPPGWLADLSCEPLASRCPSTGWSHVVSVC